MQKANVLSLTLFGSSDENEILHGVWMMIFGLFNIELDETDSFEIEIDISNTETKIKIGHDDPKTTETIGQAFNDKVHLHWPLATTLRALGKTCAHTGHTPNLPS